MKEIRISWENLPNLQRSYPEFKKDVLVRPNDSNEVILQTFVLPR